MSTRRQSMLVFAAIAILIPTYCQFTNREPDRVPGTGPIKEPSPVALRICAKELITDALVDNQISIFEAATMFRETDKLLADKGSNCFALGDMQSNGNEISDDERLCRTVIHWIRTRGRFPETVKRLEAVVRQWNHEGNAALPQIGDLAPWPALLIGQARARWLAESRGSMTVPRRFVNG